MIGIEIGVMAIGTGIAGSGAIRIGPRGAAVDHARRVGIGIAAIEWTLYLYIRVYSHLVRSTQRRDALKTFGCLCG